MHFLWSTHPYSYEMWIIAREDNLSALIVLRRDLLNLFMSRKLRSAEQVVRIRKQSEQGGKYYCRNFEFRY